MHGIIFAELKKYVDQKVGPTVWEALLDKAGMSGRIFMPVQEYPDGDAFTLVSTASAMTGTPPGTILEDFGEFIAPDLLRMYASQLRPEWRTLDVVEHTEETVHTVVRRRNPGAAPPYLRAVRTSPEEVVVHYTSARRMCAVARGIVRGLAKHYDERVTITEPVCMIKGGPECTIVVRRLPAKAVH